VNAENCRDMRHFIVQLMHTNYKILRLLKWLKLYKAHIKPSSGSNIKCLAKITYLVSMCVYTHIGTRYVILTKHCMWLPDDGCM